MRCCERREELGLELLEWPGGKMRAVVEGVQDGWIFGR